MAHFEVDGLEGWTFVADEVSAGHYRVHGRHFDGRSVERHGSDFDAVRAESINDARTLGQKANADRALDNAFADTIGNAETSPNRSPA